MIKGTNNYITNNTIKAKRRRHYDFISIQTWNNLLMELGSFLYVIITEYVSQSLTHSMYLSL